MIDSETGGNPSSILDLKETIQKLCIEYIKYKVYVFVFKLHKSVYIKKNWNPTVQNLLVLNCVFSSTEQSGL